MLLLSKGCLKATRIRNWAPVSFALIPVISTSKWCRWMCVGMLDVFPFTYPVTVERRRHRHFISTRHSVTDSHTNQLVVLTLHANKLVVLTSAPLPSASSANLSTCVAGQTFRHMSILRQRANVSLLIARCTTFCFFPDNWLTDSRVHAHSAVTHKPKHWRK